VTQALSFTGCDGMREGAPTMGGGEAVANFILFRKGGGRKRWSRSILIGLKKKGRHLAKSNEKGLPGGKIITPPRAGGKINSLGKVSPLETSMKLPNGDEEEDATYLQTRSSLFLRLRGEREEGKYVLFWGGNERVDSVFLLKGRE